MSFNINTSRLSGKEIASFQSSLETIYKDQDSSSGRTYLEIDGKSLTPEATHDEQKKASFIEIQSLISTLAKSEISQDDVKSFNEMMGLFQKVALHDHPTKKTEIESLFHNTFRSGAEKSIKDFLLFKVIDSSEHERILKVVEEGKKRDLSESESIAIFLQTKQIYLLSNSLARGQKELFQQEVKNYLEFNKENRALKELSSLDLESVSRLLMTELEFINQEMQRGLKKLPPVLDEVFRGDLLSEEELQRMETKKYSDFAFMSFSVDDDEALEFAYRYPTNTLEKHHAMIKAISKTGRDISFLSGASYEKEVIFLPNTQFKVTEFKKSQKTNMDQVTFDLYEIILEEEV